jgi:hypothetical protein
VVLVLVVLAIAVGGMLVVLMMLLVVLGLVLTGCARVCTRVLRAYLC